MSELFSKELQTGGISFRYAKGKSIAKGKEFHEFHEFILFLAGDAALVTEKFRIQLKPNTLIVVPKENYHQLVSHGDEEKYLRCVLHFENAPFGGELLSNVSIYPVDREIDYLFDILKRQTEDATREKDTFLLQSVLTLLIHALSGKKAESFTPFSNSLIQEALIYIEGHLKNGISSELVARSLNVSLSTLQHIFKREMQISLHQYILKKRLIAARQEIFLGMPATSVASIFGFHDYSGFYKQYKKLFGMVPSQSASEQ